MRFVLKLVHVDDQQEMKELTRGERVKMRQPGKE